jgi:hypothetical protein
VNLSVTIDAGGIREMAPPVALRTQGLDVTAIEQEAIGRSVGRMTAAAPFNFLGKMFVNPGSTLFRVAFETGFFFCNDIGLTQAGPFTCPMGAVAIGTFDFPLDDFMRISKIEFRFDILVAGETEVGFFFLQEILTRRFSVNLMAIIAPHRAQLMDRSSKLKQVLLFLMAIQAGIGPGLGLGSLERKNHSLSLGSGVFPSRSVAGFASLLIRGRLRIPNVFPVGVVLLEGIEDIGVALLAALCPDIFIVPLFLLTIGGETNEGYNHAQGDYGYRHTPGPLHSFLLQ